MSNRSRRYGIVMMCCSLLATACASGTRSAAGESGTRATTTTTERSTTDSSTSDSSTTTAPSSTIPAKAGAANEALSARTAELPAPGDTWPTSDPTTEGFDPAKLEEAAALADTYDSTCLFVTRNGKAVFEKYWDGASGTSQNDAFSVTKSVVSALVGQAVDSGKLHTSDLATTFIPEWNGTSLAPVTIENLLHMDAGLPSDTDNLVPIMGTEDWTSAAIGTTPVAKPNTEFNYSNADVQSLERVISSATSQPTLDLAKQHVLEALGMNHSSFRVDPTGHMAAFFGLLSNCPDLARFGLLYLNRGAWNGQQLLSKDWVLSSLTPSPLNPRYGYLWWLDDPATPLLPADSFAARGARGQQILVVPSKGIVITRMASMSTGERQPDEIGSAVLAALTK